MNIHDYIKDRDEAMMAYPDTSKLEALYKKYEGLYSPEFKRRWSKASDQVKVMTLEKMIFEWAGAPKELIAKVKTAHALKARNCALMKYPDTSGYDEYERKYEDGLFACTKGIWRRMSPEDKIKTMEMIILNWTEAPAELVAKVNEAREERLRS